ncbi:MAG: hypothetical protein WA869_37010 [Alloacidobacterium sp.]|jgi:hypothetical protein
MKFVRRLPCAARPIYMPAQEPGAPSFRAVCERAGKQECFITYAKSNKGTNTVISWLNISAMNDGDERSLVRDSQVIESLRAEIEKAEPSRRARILEKFILAALSSIPWVGGVLSAAENFRVEEGTNRLNHLQTEWLKEHQKKIAVLGQTLEEIVSRLNSLGDEIDERVQSEEYLALVRKAFRIWDESDTEEKRRLLSNVITNAAGTRACSDDVIRLFLDWIKLYNEVHFAVIREIYQNPGSTRFDIWTGLYGEIPREDSSDADLYKFLIRELSTGGVIRQERDVNSVGQFVRKRPRYVRKGRGTNHA